MTISGITTCLWFDGQAQQAADFYVGLFDDAEMGDVSHLPDGSVLTAEFQLFGQKFLALNGGPHYTLTPAVSFQVFCDTQVEIDHLWSSLTSHGGHESRCGWCTDRFGVSWQVIPRVLPELLGHADAEVATYAHTAMLQMGRLVIDGLTPPAGDSVSEPSAPVNLSPTHDPL